MVGYSVSISVDQVLCEWNFFLACAGQTNGNTGRVPCVYIYTCLSVHGDVCVH